jgi:predicted nucleotidyltransferase
MKHFGISENTYKVIQLQLSHYKQIEVVFIFGSRAKGNFRPGSDIDLAIKGKDCTSALAMELSAKLNEGLPIPYKVDIVNYNSLNHQELKEHIDRIGIEFYRKD